MDYITVQINSTITYSTSFTITISNVSAMSLVGGVNVFYCITGYIFSSNYANTGPLISVARLSSTSLSFNLVSICQNNYYIYSISFLAVTVNLAQSNAAIIRSIV